VSSNFGNKKSFTQVSSQGTQRLKGTGMKAQHWRGRCRRKRDGTCRSATNYWYEPDPHKTAEYFLARIIITNCSALAACISVFGLLAVWRHNKPKTKSTPLVCISDVIGLLTVWRHNKPKTKTINLGGGPLPPVLDLVPPGS